MANENNEPGAHITNFGTGPDPSNPDDPSKWTGWQPPQASKGDVIKHKLGLDVRFPPSLWLRKWCEYWGEKPKHSWTVGGLFTKNKFVVWPLSRGARLAERVMMAKGLLFAAPIIVAHPLALPIVIPLILSAKCEALGLGIVAQGCTTASRFVVQMFDQIINGHDDQRRKKAEEKGIIVPEPTQANVFDRLIKYGNTGHSPTNQFNSNAAPGGSNDPYNIGNTVIWGAAGSAPQPGNGQKYEEPFQVPSEDTVRVGSSGRESGWQHNHHIGSSGPRPSHGHGGGG